MPKNGLDRVLSRRQLTSGAEIMGNLVTFQSGPRWRVDWFDYKINARCDDPSQRCPCNLQTPTIAYTIQRKDQTPAVINFCPLYFNTRTLNRAMEEGRGRGSPSVDGWANIMN